MSKNGKEIDKICKYIIDKLATQGFRIHQYDSFSSNSVYLKLDYGVCNSIRISDHDGKSYLKYRYNLILNGEINIVEDKYTRYFYDEKHIDNLLSQILFDKKCKISTYSESSYNNFMIKNNREHAQDKGFWKNVKLIVGSPIH